MIIVINRLPLLFLYGDKVKRIMKTIDLIIKQLGKVRLTCNGKYDINKSYDDLCLVHNGQLASYISRKKFQLA